MPPTISMSETAGMIFGVFSAGQELRRAYSGDEEVRICVVEVVADESLRSGIADRIDNAKGEGQP
jgi:hypothetical protein